MPVFSAHSDARPSTKIRPHPSWWTQTRLLSNRESSRRSRCGVYLLIFVWIAVYQTPMMRRDTRATETGPPRPVECERGMFWRTCCLPPTNFSPSGQRNFRTRIHHTALSQPPQCTVSPPSHTGPDLHLTLNSSHVPEEIHHTDESVAQRGRLRANR